MTVSVKLSKDMDGNADVVNYTLEMHLKDDPWWTGGVGGGWGGWEAEFISCGKPEFHVARGHSLEGSLRLWVFM